MLKADVYLTSGKLFWAKLLWVELLWATLNRASINRAKLQRTNLAGANLEKADFTDAKGLTWSQLKRGKHWQHAIHNLDCGAEASEPAKE